MVEVKHLLKRLDGKIILSERDENLLKIQKRRNLTMKTTHTLPNPKAVTLISGGFLS
jgi:hypothetical protein